MHARPLPPLHHQTYWHTAADGTERAWDVTSGLAMAHDGREPVVFGLNDHGVTPARVLELYQGINVTYAMETDVTEPLLGISFYGESLIIDGWHRLYKAAALGRPEVLMYLLTEEEAASIQWLALPPTR